MKFLVCGGAGFIGKNFINFVLNESQISKDVEITVVDNLTYAGNFENLKDIFSQIDFIKGNITDYKLMRDLVIKNDFILNFAAESHVDNSILQPDIFMTSNILGAHTLFNLSCKYNKRILQVSTDEVYGSVETPAFETNNLNPSSPYSSSKASADLVGLSYYKTFGLNVVITRSCNNYGPFQHPEKLIPKTITNLLSKKKVPLYGNGENTREWIHVSDNSRAILNALMNGTAGDIYNIGSGIHLSNLELVLKIMEIMNISSKSIEFVKDRLGHDVSYRINSDKIKALGHQNQIGFDLGILDCVNWYSSNLRWWKNLI